MSRLLLLHMLLLPVAMLCHMTSARGMPHLDAMQAKWALDAAGISYKLSPYGFSPFYLGELPFRWRIGKLFDRITAPMMLLPVDQGRNAKSPEVRAQTDKLGTNRRLF
jgi:hypothetical protein